MGTRVRVPHLEEFDDVRALEKATHGAPTRIQQKLQLLNLHCPVADWWKWLDKGTPHSSSRRTWRLTSTGESLPWRGRCDFKGMYNSNMNATYTITNMLNNKVCCSLDHALHFSKNLTTYEHWKKVYLDADGATRTTKLKLLLSMAGQ